MRRSILAVAVLRARHYGRRRASCKPIFGKEGEHIKESCGTIQHQIAGRVRRELATDHPLHIAVGSIAPQNGFGVGGAFAAHYTPNGAGG